MPSNSPLQQALPEPRDIIEPAAPGRVIADEVAMLSDGLAEAVGDPLQIEIHTSLATAEADWRKLEETGVLTPYQRVDWIAPWVAARRVTNRIAIVVIRAAGRPIALLPLQLSQRLGLIRANIVGSEIGNSDWLLHDPKAAGLLTEAALRDVLADVAHELGGIDYLVFANQPPSWQGFANPLLALPHQPASDNFYYAEMGATALPKKRRVDILRGKRRLEENFGPVTLRRAETPEQIAAAHAAFLAHRNARFAVMGVDNVFARPEFLRFFEAAATAGIGNPRPALCFHTLHAGDEIVATACGAYTESHYSQYINSNTDGPASRYSLMGLLMYELMQELAASGLRSIDMGIGNFAYKASWTAPVEVFDTIVPLSFAGKPVTPMLLAGGRAKRAIKANAKLFDAAKRLRQGWRHLLSRG